MHSLAFLTTCKGRLHHLKETLPLMVAQNPDEIVVVDYDCPDGTAEWVASNYPQVTVCKVENAPRFSPSKARNAGARMVKSDAIFFVDADVRVVGDLVEWAGNNVRDGGFYRVSRKEEDSIRSLTGSFICLRKDFERIGGYDEAIRLYSGEDSDAYNRLKAIGVSDRKMPLELFDSIGHADTERVKFFSNDDVERGIAVSMAYKALKYRLTEMGHDLPLCCRKLIYDEVVERVDSRFFDIRFERKCGECGRNIRIEYRSGRRFRFFGPHTIRVKAEISR